MQRFLCSSLQRTEKLWGSTKQDICTLAFYGLLTSNSVDVVPFISCRLSRFCRCVKCARARCQFGPASRWHGYSSSLSFPLFSQLDHIQDKIHHRNFSTWYHRISLAHLLAPVNHVTISSAGRAADTSRGAKETLCSCSVQAKSAFRKHVCHVFYLLFYIRLPRLQIFHWDRYQGPNQIQIPLPHQTSGHPPPVMVYILALPPRSLLCQLLLREDQIAARIRMMKKLVKGSGSQRMFETLTAVRLMRASLRLGIFGKRVRGGRFVLILKKL